MLDRERHDRVARSLDSLSGFQLDDLHRKRRSLESERLRAIQHAARATGSPEAQPLDTALKRHGAHQSDHAEQVVGVHVGEEDVLEREGHSISHHLSLRALAAVEHQRLAPPVNRERRHVALDGWARRGRAEETNVERHGVNIAGAWNCFCDDTRVHASNTMRSLDIDAKDHEEKTFANDTGYHPQTQAAVSRAAPKVARSRKSNDAAARIRSAG